MVRRLVSRLCSQHNHFFTSPSSPSVHLDFRIMGRWFFSAVLIITSLPLFGQRIENLRASFADGKVTILYDITGGNEKQVYSIELFGSHNNYSTSLRIVQGDVGGGIKSGRNLTIIWDAQAELGTHNGGITFRVSGNPIPMKLTILSPGVGSTMRRGKNAMLQWEGGVPEQQVKIELYRGNERITLAGDSRNTGSYSWTLPKDLPRGGYALHFTNGPEKVVSDVFEVKARIPLALKVGPAVAVAGAFLFIKPPPPPQDKLPIAPDPQ